MAAELGRPVADLDERIEESTGRSTAALFAQEGERGFRQLELNCLEGILDGPPVVLATGGGVVTLEPARELLRLRCVVVWLTASVKELLRRLAVSSEVRPLLSGDPATTLHRLAEEREAWYRDLATLHIDVEGSTPEAVVEQILDALDPSTEPT